MVFNPEDRKVYESLECKDDEIGKGLSDFAKGRSLFYVAIIDVDKIDKVGIDVENTEIFKTVCVKDAVRDYRDSVMVGSRELPHRYGCSGIDGVAIAPKIGKASGKNFLYVAYGIYGNVDRSDNDCQVLLRYDIQKLNKLAKPVRFGEFDETGPERALDKIFINTGNTSYGIQNMAYDPSQRRLFMAVYKGKKPQYRNYSLFAVDFSAKPSTARLTSLYPYDGARRSFVPDSWNGNRHPDQPTHRHPELLLPPGTSSGALREYVAWEADFGISRKIIKAATAVKPVVPISIAGQAAKSHSNACRKVSSFRELPG